MCVCVCVRMCLRVPVCVCVCVCGKKEDIPGCLITSKETGGVRLSVAGHLVEEELPVCDWTLT